MKARIKKKWCKIVYRCRLAIMSNDLYCKRCGLGLILKRPCYKSTKVMPSIKNVKDCYRIGKGKIKKGFSFRKRKSMYYKFCKTLVHISEVQIWPNKN